MPATTLADKVIIGLALIFLAWLYSHYWFQGTEADYAIILVAQQPPQYVRLNQTQKITVSGRIGNTLIEVAPGQIRFLAAPCRGQYCVHAGWLKHGGDFVACLPNQVSIELVRQTEPQFDAIAY